MITEMKTIQDENRRLKKMFAELSMQNELLKEALGKKPAILQGDGTQAIVQIIASCGYQAIAMGHGG